MSLLAVTGQPCDKVHREAMTHMVSATHPTSVNVDPMSEAWHLEYITAKRGAVTEIRDGQADRRPNGSVHSLGLIITGSNPACHLPDAAFVVRK